MGGAASMDAAAARLARACTAASSRGVDVAADGTAASFEVADVGGDIGCPSAAAAGAAAAGAAAEAAAVATPLAAASVGASEG